MSHSRQCVLLIQLVALHSKIQKSTVGPLSQHGISLTEYLVLMQLQDTPGHTLRRIDLAERVGLSASGITRLLNPMEKIGLVDKQESARDARVSLVTLTEAGARVFEEAGASLDAVAWSLFSPLSATQTDSISRALNTVM